MIIIATDSQTPSFGQAGTTVDLSAASPRCHRCVDKLLDPQGQRKKPPGSLEPSTAAQPPNNNYIQLEYLKCSSG